jgi:hypothetical protein
VHKIIFTKYETGKDIKLVCTNYRNPIYAKIIPGFGLKVEDREEPNNYVAQYPNWNFVIDTLASRELPMPLKFDFYMNNSDSPTTDLVPIQTDVGLSIEFDMA